MHISQIFTSHDPDLETVRSLVRYAQEDLGFTGEIGHKTDVTALAKEHAEYAADALEIPRGDRAVGRAEEELLKLGQDHQQDLPSQLYGDAREERDASYGEWKSEQRQADRDVERGK